MKAVKVKALLTFVYVRVSCRVKYKNPFVCVVLLLRTCNSILLRGNCDNGESSRFTICKYTFIFCYTRDLSGRVTPSELFAYGKDGEIYCTSDMPIPICVYINKYIHKCMR